MTTAKPKQERKKRKPKSRIPIFKTIEEEAEFWDTHDSTEFEDEWEEVTEDIRWIVIRGGPKKRMSITLDVDTLAELQALARSLDVRPATLACPCLPHLPAGRQGQVWVYERLHHERTREGRRGSSYHPECKHHKRSGAGPRPAPSRVVVRLRYTPTPAATAAPSRSKGAYILDASD